MRTRTYFRTGRTEETATAVPLLRGERKKRTPADPSPLPRGEGGRRPGEGSFAFSLIEILVAVSLLSFIVLGLLLMFNQTQRAFRGSMNQVDVLESGRIFTDMIAREMEQASASMGEPVFFNGGVFEHTNFFAELAPTFTPSIQGLPGSPALRTNIVQRFFFLSRLNQEWMATGYFVMQDAGADVGALYRFSATKRPPFTDYDLSGYFQAEVNRTMNLIQNNLPVTNVSKVADGIVHLKVRTFAPNGQPLLPYVSSSNLVVRLPNLNFDDVAETYWAAPGKGLQDLNDYAGVYFVGHAMPAAVELEIGVLEQNILGRYKALMGNATAQRNYLSNHVGNVHIFRQRIPIRNVDIAVYP